MKKRLKKLKHRLGWVKSNAELVEIIDEMLDILGELEPEPTNKHDE